MDKIKEALKSLELLHHKEPVARYRNWIVTRKKWHPEDEPEIPEDTGMEFYCDKCIKKAMRKYKESHPNVIVGYSSDQCPEYEGFIHCWNCEIHIESGLLVDEQEIEHWEELEDNRFDITWSEVAYELYEIFDKFRFIEDKLKPRIEKLAEKVIAIKERQVNNAVTN